MYSILCNQTKTTGIYLETSNAELQCIVEIYKYIGHFLHISLSELRKTAK